MLQFSKLTKFDFSKFNKEELKEFFKDTPESELAFLCRYNATIPLFFCPIKWKYHPTQKSDIYYTSIEKIKYNIFLASNGYYVISFDYIYGILSFLGLAINMKGKKSKSTKLKTISKNSEKILKVNTKIVNTPIKLRYKGSGQDKKVHIDDAIKMLYLFEELEKQDVFDWNELNDLPVDFMLMLNI
jgi:hypothetical protein